jgi:hypothetical protein
MNMLGGLRKARGIALGTALAVAAVACGGPKDGDAVRESVLHPFGDRATAPASGGGRAGGQGGAQAGAGGAEAAHPGGTKPSAGAVSVASETNPTPTPPVVSDTTDAGSPTGAAEAVKAPPTIVATPTMGPLGAEVTIAGATFSAPPGSVPEGTTLQLTQRGADFSAVIDRVPPERREGLVREMAVLKSYEIGPSGTTFATPATVSLTLSEADLPPGRGFDDVGVVLVSGENFEDVPFRRTSNGIVVEVPHCSLLLVLTAFGGLALLGSMAMMMRGHSEPIMRRDCARWIDRDNAKLTGIANDPARFGVDTKAGTIKLDVGRPLKGKNVTQGAHALRPHVFIDKPEGDCVNFSGLFASLLSAKGYPVRLVAGNASYPGYSGLHQWVETVIDGKAYYVDTFNPGATRLVPLEEANTSLKLSRTRMCGREADGTAVGPGNYDPHWIRGLISDNDAMLKRYHALRAEHRVLHEACISGNNGACTERRQVYLEAMEMRRKLEAQGIQVIGAE